MIQFCYYCEIANSSLGAALRKDGNISNMIWQVRGRERQAYGFTYDGYNRIKTARYGELNPAGALTVNDRYRTDYTYIDLRGNISTLKRNGIYWDGACWQQGQIDNLSYSYVTGTNKLRSVNDLATAAGLKEQGFKETANADYLYDPTGNLIYDPDKRMNISYNYLNLPEWIETDDCKRIAFTYDAAGNKLRKTTHAGEMPLLTHDYAGSIEYENGAMEAIYHEEGRVYFEDGEARYEYAIRDHLGNTRVMFADLDGNGVISVTGDPETTEILQEDHYYPFGMAIAGPWMANVGRENDYRYNGKELNSDFGLNWYAYGARWYDPAVGRFTGVDPISDQFPHLSTFNYASNDPIRNIDLHGLQGVSATGGPTPSAAGILYEAALNIGNVQAP